MTENEQDNREAWQQAVKLRDVWARVECGDQNLGDRQREMACALLAAIELFHDTGLDAGIKR